MNVLSQIQRTMVIVLPMDPLCLPISDTQPCPGTQCDSRRGKVTPLICHAAISLRDGAWNSTGCRPPAEQQLDTGASERKKRERKKWKWAVDRSQSKVLKYAPWIINTQINLFNVQEWRADYRGMCGVGGRCARVQLHISGKHTTAREAAGVCRGDGREPRDWGEGQNTLFYFLVFISSFSFIFFPPSSLIAAAIPINFHILWINERFQIDSELLFLISKCFSLYLFTGLCMWCI